MLQINYDESGNIKMNLYKLEKKGNPAIVSRDEVEYIDVATNQAYL